MGTDRLVTFEQWLELLAEVAWRDWDAYRELLQQAAEQVAAARSSTEKNKAG